MTTHTAEALVSRRRALGLLGAGVGVAAAGATTASLLPSAAQAATATASATCGEVTDQSTIGPYYVDEGLVRSTITSGQEGTTLTLTMAITNATTCTPLVGAAVDIWHANAAGTYSDEQSEGTLGQTWLRGIQLTDSAGQVTFTTIVPGWYAGRTMHVHAKVRTGGTLSGTSYTGGTNVWIGQLFFTEAVSQAIAAVVPYSSSRTTRQLNSQDTIYQGADGASTTIAMSGAASTAYTGAVAIAVAGGSSSTPVAQCTIEGATTRTTTYGGTVTLTGTAPAGSEVEVFFRPAGGSSYTARRAVTAGSSGQWSTTYSASTSFAIYAESSGDVSDPIVVLLAPTIAGATTRTVRRGASITLTGTSVPSTTTTLYLHKAGTTGFGTVIPVATNARGVWAKTITPGADHTYYAKSAHGPRSVTKAIDVR